MSNQKGQRTDVHRPSAIDPADYEYRWAFDTAFSTGPTAARFERALRSSTTSVYRSANRCDHCGAHLRYAVVYEHLPTGEMVCTGQDCAENTMSVPSRMRLRLERFKRLTKMRRERRKRKDAAYSRHPEAVDALDVVARGGYSSAPDFVKDIARKFRRHGYLTRRQAGAIENVLRLPGARHPRKSTREDRGRDLFEDGRYRKIEDGMYEVEGSGDEAYVVTTDPEDCPCIDSGKGNRCKHVICAHLAEDAEADGNAVSGAVATAGGEA